MRWIGLHLGAQVGSSLSDLLLKLSRRGALTALVPSDSGPRNSDSARSAPLAEMVAEVAEIVQPESPVVCPGKGF
jgi:hypothetical protein